MGVELDNRYQTQAYEAIKKTRKAGVVLPTGTGKTYLALKLIEDNIDKEQILYISPSPTINVQVRKKIKEIYSKEEAEAILSKVKFVTYSGLDKRFKHDKFDMKEFNSDVIILDEVHRSGAEDWGKAVDYLLETNDKAQILGMTATPLRSDGQNMIEKRFGDVTYELKLSEAVAIGILTLPTYISSRYIFKEDIQNIQEKINNMEDVNKKKEFQEKIDNAKKSIENASGMKEILGKHMKNGRWLVFCNPGDDIEKLQKQAQTEEWFEGINKNQTFLIVESTRPDIENEMALRKFERKGGEDLRILYSKNMLNEGIHNEEITGEIMLRPTKSYILFTQQLGRILSKERPETPIVLDLVGNIKYFKEFRLEIKNIIRKGIERGDTRYNEKTLEQFRVLEEQEDFIQAFEEIEKSIETYINRTSIEETLEILEIIKKEGVDLEKIQKFITEHKRTRTTYLYEIPNENIEEIIQKHKLDRNYPIGIKISRMMQAYNGTSPIKIAEEDKKRIEQLGLAQKEKTVLAETLDIIEILLQEKIDIRNIQNFVTNKGKARSKYLYEVEDDRIETIIKEYGLDRDYPIGSKISVLKRTYRGKSTYNITEEDRKKIERLGIISEEKSVIEETLDILEILKEENIDVRKIRTRVTENSKRRGTYLYEVENENIEEIIQKHNFDREYKIGRKMIYVINAYKGRSNAKISEQHKKRVEELGLVSRLEQKEAKKSELIQKLQDTRELKKLVKKELDIKDNSKDIEEGKE